MQGGWLLLASLGLGLACNALPLNDQCRYNGRAHATGDTFPSSDGCNTCSCASGGVTCTARACLAEGGAPDLGNAPDDAGPIVADGGPIALDGGAPPDAPVICLLGGHTYTPGVFFPSADGCNLCQCSETGVRCTARACPVGVTDCTFERTYRFHDDGGEVAFTDRSTLSPPRTHLLARDHFGNALPNQCSIALGCVDPTRVDVVEIQQALADADVVAALAQPTPPFYGTDTRPVDGTVFVFERDDGRGFSVGSGPVPAGLRLLVDLLHLLRTQTVATPACAGL